MQATVQLEWTDYLAALRLHGRLSGAYVVLAFFGLAAVYWTFIVVQTVLRGATSSLVFLAPFYLVVAVVYGGYFFLGPRNARRVFEQSQEQHLPMTVEVSADGLQQVNALGQTLRPWDHFIKWAEDGQLLLLFIANNQFVILPKRALPAAMQAQIKAYLQAVPQARALALFSVRRWSTCLVYLLIVVAIVVLLFQFRSQAR